MPDTATMQVDLAGNTVRVALQSPYETQFWQAWPLDNWERDTINFIQEFAATGGVLIDIGAWVGPFSMIAAAQGADVIALEPDPVAHASLVENVRLNSNLPGRIQVLQNAFDRRHRKVRLFGNPGGFGSSGSSPIVLTSRWTTVRTVTASDLIRTISDNRPVAIKCDIEGHEYYCAAALANLREQLDASLHLSIHPRLLRRHLRGHRLFGMADKAVLKRTQRMVERFSDCDLKFYSFAGSPLKADLADILAEELVFSLAART